MATLEDIARALGTTKGTVSKALNGAPDVSEATRKLILDKAVELGYSRVLRNNAGRVCIFVENMHWENPGDFGYEIITGFRQAAEPAHYAVDVIPLDISTQRSSSYDSYMLLHDYRGAFFLGLSLSDPWIRTFPSARTPLVLLDGSARTNPNVSSVEVDSSEGMNLAVTHLKELGHTRIGYLSTSLGSTVYQQRYLAFFHALRQNGLPYRNAPSRHSYYLADQIGNDLPWLIRQGCTAILCSHDSLAMAALTYCQENGIPVPEQLSIIGFDDLPFIRNTFPPMTTIRQDRIQLGKSAFFSLSSHFAGVPISKLMLHASLVVRQSTGPAPTAPIGPAAGSAPTDRISPTAGSPDELPS